MKTLLKKIANEINVEIVQINMIVLIKKTENYVREKEEQLMLITV